MNAKEAREAIKHPKESWDFQRGQAYLEALEGPEVKALVEALNYIHNNSYAPVLIEVNKIAREALAQYREAIKK